MYCDKFRGVGDKAVSVHCILESPVHTRIRRVSVSYRESAMKQFGQESHHLYTSVAKLLISSHSKDLR